MPPAPQSHLPSTSPAPDTLHLGLVYNKIVGSAAAFKFLPVASLGAKMLSFSFMQGEKSGGETAVAEGASQSCQRVFLGGREGEFTARHGANALGAERDGGQLLPATWEGLMRRSWHSHEDRGKGEGMPSPLDSALQGPAWLPHGPAPVFCWPPWQPLERRCCPTQESSSAGWWPKNASMEPALAPRKS